MKKISSQQIKSIMQIMELAKDLNIESEDFPESTYKFLAALDLNAGWLYNELVSLGQIPTKKRGRPKNA